MAIYTFHWDPLFQLDSGPTWFVAGLVLADRRLLPDSWAVRPTLGFAGGLFAVGCQPTKSTTSSVSGTKGTTKGRKKTPAKTLKQKRQTKKVKQAGETAK